MSKFFLLCLSFISLAVAGWGPPLVIDQVDYSNEADIALDNEGNAIAV